MAANSYINIKANRSHARAHKLYRLNHPDTHLFPTTLSQVKLQLVTLDNYIATQVLGGLHFSVKTQNNRAKVLLKSSVFTHVSFSF